MKYSRALPVSALALAGLIVAGLASAAPLPNAWRILHNTTAGSSTVYYTNQLIAAQRIASTNVGFHFTVNARFVDDFNSAGETMTMIYGLGNKRFLIWWGLDSASNLTVRLENGLTYTLTTNGTGTALYHTHEIIYTNGTASYAFDGVNMTNNWQPSGNAGTNGLISWGAGSSANKGEMNFNRVTFEVTNTVVASYDAGTNGNPAVAPDPETKGWTLVPAMTLPNGTAIGDVSPDTETLLPAGLVATTVAATNVQPHLATLRGTVELHGLAANAWFEWGTTTNYGNTLPPQFFKADTNAISHSVALHGLTKGTTYHFRCVATNLLGIAYGQDVLFTTPSLFVVNSHANTGPGSLRQSIADAISGDTITFGVTGTIMLTSGQLLLTNNLTISGPGPALLAVSGGDASRVFMVNSAVTGSISGITIRNGHAPDGAAGDPGGAGGSGGGVFCLGTLAFSNCVITANTAGKGGNGTSSSSGGGNNGGVGGNGGGIYNAGTLTLTACTVSTNTAGDGGRGGNGAAGTAANPDGSVGGTGGLAGRGGGIFNSATLALIASTVNNNAAGDGGAGGNGGQGVLGVPSAFGAGGHGGTGGAGGSGGGLNNEGPMATLATTNCTLYKNSAGSGGSGGTGGGITSANVLGSAGPGGNGGAAGNGGGAHNAYSLVLTACTISTNKTGAGGAGGDGGAGLGGGTVNHGGDGGDGRSGGNGGGLYSTAGALVSSLWNTIVAQNAPGSGGQGGNGVDGGSSGSSGNSGIGLDLNGTFQSQGHNLIGYGGTFTLTGLPPGDLVPPSGQTINPILSPLADNGGPTLTVSLTNFLGLAFSPAIDAGDDALFAILSIDQRGYPRRSGPHVDIGALELQVASTNNRPLLTQTRILINGAFMFSFTNGPGLGFSVYASTNVALPLGQWIKLGTATQASPGQYQYTDPTATNYPQRFYQVIWP